MIENFLEKNILNKVKLLTLPVVLVNLKVS